MELKQLTELVVDALEDVRGQEIKVLDVSRLTALTDYMIIASGTSDRQVKALAQNVITKVKASGIQPAGVEGEREGEWILVDLHDVVVHVMASHTRAFYQLEKLWDMPEAAAGGQH
jgi:ribosome-associated protein